METVTVFIYIMMFAIVALILLVVFRTGRTFMKNKKLFVKSPKMSGRDWLVDPRYGSAMIIGKEPIGIDKSNLLLQMRSGHTMKIPYGNQDIYPENPILAASRTGLVIWRVKGVYYPDGMVDKAKAELESQNIELSHEAERQKLIKKVEVNEAATLKDAVMDIVKEMREQKQGEVIVKGK